MLAIWTDKPGYLRGRDTVRAYLAMQRAGDPRRHREFIYLEHIGTGRRQYLARTGDHLRLVDEIVDVLGRPARRPGGAWIRDLLPTKIWSGRLLEAGLWQFVAELRSLDTTEIVKTAHAKFVVAATQPVLLGADGRDTEIRTDTTWTSDRIYALRHQVFVNAGATLTIEPGTLIVGLGPHAMIVVERGGRVEARGRADAPIVMTCDSPLGQRYEGCWGGLVLLGNAPLTRGTELAGGILPQSRPLYGGGDRLDSSGTLQYVRVEFAGAGTSGGAGPAGLGLYGVGSGTLLDHVQVHASAGDGILFAGGSANCTFCVASGALDSALAWTLGWQGIAQHVFLQVNPGGAGPAVEGRNDELGFDALPRSAPTLYNLTLVGDVSGGWARSSRRGILLRSGSAVTARNVIVMGFPEAIGVRDNSMSLFNDGTSSISNSILYSGRRQWHPGARVLTGLDGIVGYRDVEPMLVNVAYRANPDPRPMLNAPALRVGAGAVPPSDGICDTSAQYIGAFGGSNWLAEWTFFGPESDYDTRQEN